MRLGDVRIFYNDIELKSIQDATFYKENIFIKFINWLITPFRILYNRNKYYINATLKEINFNIKR
jgi:hypothetical protein